MKPFPLLIFVLFILAKHLPAQSQPLATLWDVELRQPQSDKIHDAILTADGRLALVGETSNGAYKQGLFLLVDTGDGSLLRREEFGGNKDDVFFSITEAEEQSFYLVGYSDKGGQLGRQAWIVRLDETGGFIAEKFYGEKGNEEFRQIVWNDGPNGSLAGTKAAFGEGNLWFSRINHQLGLYQETILGDGVYANAKGMEKITGDSVWLCGETRKSGGYDKGDLWVAAVDEKGREKNLIFGSKQIERLASANIAPNGNILLAAETYDTPTGTGDAMIVEMDRSFKTALYESLGSKEPNRASAIFKSYYGNYWACTHPDPVGAPPGLQLIIRKEQLLVEKFHLKLNNGDGFEAVQLLRTPSGRHILAGNTTGKSNRPAVRLICMGDVELLASKTADKAVSVSHGLPYLEDDTNNDGLLSPNERGIFKFDLLNHGDDDLLNLQISASLGGQSPGVALTIPVRHLHILPKKGGKTVSFGLKTDPSLQDGNLPIHIEVIFNGQVVHRFSHEIECRKNAAPARSDSQPVVMRWLSPVSGNSREIDHTSGNYVKISMMTTVDKKNVRTTDFKITNNGSLLQDEKHTDGILFGPSEREAGRFDYTFDYTVKGLQKGRNVIVVELFGRTDSLVVNYNVDDPNLYVLAIGVTGGSHYENLQFTAKDAGDFAAAVEAQKGRGFFNQIIVEELTTEQATNKTAIVSAFEKLYNRYRLGNIQEKDYVVVYYSGHGNKLDDRFFMLPSNYDRESPLSTSIDFREEVRERFLDKMKCKRILFFDACLSGSAKDETLTPDELQQAILKANKIEPGMVSFASCTSDQLSYESKNDQNGVFTKALVEALNSSYVRLSSGELVSVSGSDNLVNIGELYNFLQLRVYDLIHSIDPMKTQKPTLTVDELDRGLDIFVLEK